MSLRHSAEQWAVRIAERIAERAASAETTRRSVTRSACRRTRFMCGGGSCGPSQVEQTGCCP